MAEGNGTQLASKIEAAAKRARKLQKDKDLIDLINELDNLRKESASYNGEIARVCPSTLQAQIDILVGMFRQLQMNAKTTETALLNLVNFVDRLPNGEFRKKLIDDSDEGEDGGPELNDGILPQQTIDTTPDVSAGPQSAVLNNSPLPESLSDYYRKDFNNGALFREARESSAFSFDRITGDLDKAGIQGVAPFEIANKNMTASFPMSAQSLQESNQDNVGNAVASSFGKMNESAQHTSTKATLDLSSIAMNLPGSAGDISGSAAASMPLSESMCGGGHIVDTMWNTDEKIAAKSTPSVESGIGFDIDVGDLNIVND